MKRTLPLLAALSTIALFAGQPARAAEPPPGGGETGEEQADGLNARYLLMDAGSGRAVTHEDFPGLFQLITFGYTYCPDVCPTTLAEMSLIMKKLGPQAERLQPIFITVDPQRDTAAVLQSYTRFFHPRIVALTGSPALIKRAADNFRVRYEIAREPGAPAEQYAIDHSAGMYLLGPDGLPIRKFAFGMPPAEIAARIGEIVAASKITVRRGPAPRK